MRIYNSYILKLCVIIFYIGTSCRTKDLSDFDPVLGFLIRSNIEVSKLTTLNNYVKRGTFIDSVLHFKVQSSLSLLDSMENDLIAAAGGYVDFDYKGPPGIRNQLFSSCFDILNAKYDSDEVKYIINGSLKYVGNERSFYIFYESDNSEDPYFRSHPDYDKFKHRVWLDFFKDLNILEALHMLNLIRLNIITNEMEYYLTKENYLDCAR
jgi:hypothetical protein